MLDGCWTDVGRLLDVCWTRRLHITRRPQDWSALCTFLLQICTLSSDVWGGIPGCRSEALVCQHQLHFDPSLALLVVLSAKSVPSRWSRRRVQGTLEEPAGPQGKRPWHTLEPSRGEQANGAARAATHLLPPLASYTFLFSDFSVLLSHCFDLPLLPPPPLPLELQFWNGCMHAMCSLFDMHAHLMHLPFRATCPMCMLNACDQI